MHDQEVSEGRSPLTEIVSGGFADGAGRFSLSEKHTLREGTAVSGFAANSDGAHNSKKWLCHFFDTLWRQRGSAAFFFVCAAFLARICFFLYNR